MYLVVPFVSIALRTSFSPSGKNTLRPQQLNINVATWVRLLKRDVPQQTTPSTTQTTASRDVSEHVPTTAAPTVPVPAERSEFSAGPALPPKQTKHDQQKPTATPQPPPRIEEIQVSVMWGGRVLLVRD